MGIPLVALQGQGPEIAKQIGQVVPRQLSLRKLLDEQRAAGQTAQMNDLKIAEAQRAQQEQQALSAAYNEAGGDIDKLIQIAPSKGVSAQTMIKLQDTLMQYKKSKLDLEDSEWKAEQNRNRDIATALDAVAAVPLETQPAAWDRAVQELVGKQKITPEEAQQFGQYPGPDGIKRLSMARKTSEQINTQIDNERAAAAEAAQRKHEAEMEKSNERRDYEYAVSQGYKGTFLQWQLDQRPAKTAADQLDDLLTPAQATQLGVPYGTAKRQAFGAQGTTAATRTMTEAAPKVKQFTTKISKMISDADQGLGPMASRWRDFKQGKVGLKDPQFSALRTDVALLTTLLMRMHVGARGGEQMREHFEELLQLGSQSPENLQAAIQEIADYADAVQHVGKPDEAPAPTGEGNDKDPLGIF